MRRPEQDIHRAVLQHLDIRGTPGTFYWHTPSGAYYGRRGHIQGRIMRSLGARAGIPDLLLLRAGTLYALELKAGRNKPTEAQADTIVRMMAAGAVCGVASSLDEALVWLEQHGLLVGRAR